MKRRKATYRLRRRRFGGHDFPGGAETAAELWKREAEKIHQTSREEKPLAAPGIPEAEAEELRQRITTLEEEKAAAAERLEASETRLREARDRIQRAGMEMDNLRKRHRREVESVKKLASEDLIYRLLTVLDHFNLAVDSMAGAKDIDSVVQGVTMIKKELEGVLKAEGLAEVNPLGETFDPKFHEAAATAKDPSLPDHQVLQVMRPGWRLKDKVLRPAMVSVNKLSATPPSAEPENQAPSDQSNQNTPDQSRDSQ